MKRILLFLAAALLMVACNQKQHDEEMAAAHRTQDSLQAIVDAKDGEIDALFEMLNQIEDNLALIASKYGKVSELKRSNPEASGMVKNQISAQLSNIDQLLADNKKRIASLNEKIKSLGKENAALQDFVTKLEDRMADQERQISELTAEVESHKAVIRDLNQNVSNLTAQNEEQSRTIASQIAEANRAYFIVGTYDELKESGVVAKEGGFIGIGRKQLVESNLPTQLFRELDRTATTTIEVNMKNAVVVSSHPASSYELVTEENNEKMVLYLRILNPTLFWQNTKYLVISTK